MKQPACGHKVIHKRRQLRCLPRVLDDARARAVRDRKRHGRFRHVRNVYRKRNTLARMILTHRRLAPREERLLQYLFELQKQRARCFLEQHSWCLVCKPLRALLQQHCRCVVEEEWGCLHTPYPLLTHLTDHWWRFRADNGLPCGLERQLDAG